MKYPYFHRVGLLIGSMVAIVGLAVVPASAIATPTSTPKAAATTTSDSTTTTTTNTNANNAAQAAAKQAAANQARLQLIISRGNSEITRRLATLNTLNSKITSAVKLSSSDEAVLSGDVSSEITNLTNLKTQLDSATTVSAAVTDAQSIINDYRVYALVVPQVYLVKTADDQQAAETKLTALATKLQTRITAEQQAGKSVTTLQSDLTDLNTKVGAAQVISSGVETSVIGLQPTDYDSNHDVLGGDRNQLQTAQSDIQAALNDAKTIVSQLQQSSSSTSPSSSVTSGAN